MVTMEVSRYVFNRLPQYVKCNPCYLWQVVDYITMDDLKALINAPDGIAGLDSNGLLNLSVIPGGGGGNNSIYVGAYPTVSALTSAHHIGQPMQYALVNDDGTGNSGTYFWDSVRGTWVNQKITASAYMELSDAEKNAVLWIIIPG